MLESTKEFNEKPSKTPQDIIKDEDYKRASPNFDVQNEPGETSNLPDLKEQENENLYNESKALSQKLENVHEASEKKLTPIELNEIGKAYNKEVSEKSAAGKVNITDVIQWERIPTEKYIERRKEFNSNKIEIINEWEKNNELQWPKYEKSVCCTKNGENIRNKDDYYDAHHIKPLRLGGENIAENITPMHTNDHTDKKGIHRPNGPYTSLFDHFNKTQELRVMKSIKKILETFKEKERTRLKPPLDNDRDLKRMVDMYRDNLPSEIIELYDITEGGFIQIDEHESWRILIPKDILDATDELKVDFPLLKKLPIIDCKDNDFICYDFKSGMFQLYNIVDNIAFKNVKKLVDLF